MFLKDFLLEMESLASFSFQEPYDNSGLQLGSPQMQLRGLLICLDVTPQVVKEAVEKGCNLVLTHHPLIFKGLNRLSGETEVEKTIELAIKQDVAIVSMHTNLDNVAQGVNYKLASRLGLSKLKILDPRRGILRKLVTFCPNEHAQKVRTAIFRAGAGHIGNYDCCSYNTEGLGSFRAGEEASPFVGKIRELHFEPEIRIETIFPAYLEREVVAALKNSHPYQEVAYDIYPLENTFEGAGSGMTGTFDEPLEEAAFLQRVKQVLNVPFLKHSSFTGQPITKVALCGGGGGFLLDKAIRSGAQAFVTGEVKFHQYFEAAPGLLLVEAGHYETEQFTNELLYEIVNKKFSKFAVFISEVNTNPVRYF